MEDWRSPRDWREKKRRRADGGGGSEETGVMMRIPSACSLRRDCQQRLPGSAEEHQGREQALNLRLTLKLLTSSTSPSRARTRFYLKGLVKIKASLKQSHTGRME